MQNFDEIKTYFFFSLSNVTALFDILAPEELDNPSFDLDDETIDANCSSLYTKFIIKSNSLIVNKTVNLIGLTI